MTHRYALDFTGLAILHTANQGMNLQNVFLQNVATTPWPEIQRQCYQKHEQFKKKIANH